METLLSVGHYSSHSIIQKTGSTTATRWYNGDNIAYGKHIVVKKRHSSSRRVSVYSNLTNKRKSKKEALAKEKAEYLATLPKHPVKRALYRMHPKRVAKFWFSKRGLITLLKGVGVMAACVILMALALMAYYRKDLDAIRPETLSQRVKSTVTTYYDRNGKVLWEDKGSGDYTLVVDGDKINEYMRQATVAIEDKEFYQHGGVSVSGIVRAMISNSQGNATQGGSTLTQQLVKQVFFSDQQASERGLGGIPRKIKEMILAIEVERMYNKDQILTLYLNESPYGGRRNGVESAAQTYFGKSSSDLTLAESALLAAVPNNPTVYNPYIIDGHEALIARQHKVLDNMVDMAYITKEEAAAAKEVAILDTIKPLADQLADIKAPHFVLMVRSQLESELGKTVVGQGGLKVTTTLDLDIQQKLEGNMTAIFNGEMTNRDCSYTNCANYAGFSNGAAAIEDTKTGQVVALVGSRDFNYAGFGQDNAATAFIQPASSIKPLVYAQLFQEQGTGALNYGSGSVLTDTATTFEGNYKPQNADQKYQGNITIRQSLDRSRNIPAIKAMVVAGKDKVWKTIRDMGDTYYCTQGSEAQAGLSSAIGSCGTRLIDHVNAIASIGRLGAYVPQSTVLKVVNGSGQVLKQYQTPTNKQVVNEQAAYIVADIMADSKARASLGWNQDYLPYLNKLGVKVGAKTGTSNGEVNGKVISKDIWTVGFTPTLSMAVWLGNSDNSVLRSGNSLIPAMFFDRTMADVVKMYVDQGKAAYSDWYTTPSGIQKIGNEIYPSYYDKKAGQSTTKLTFDRVSKKKATNCTPSGAKIEASVIKTTDPVTKKEVYTSTDGYDGNSEDDVHTCGDAQPVVSFGSVNTTTDSVTVTVSKGKNTLKHVDVTCGGSTVLSQDVVANSTLTASLASITAACSLSATITDSVYYATTTAGPSYTP
jgi:penicillin-binding protein 1A